MNIVIACGGTGGHLFPGLGVAEELMKRGHKVKLCISEKPVDARVLKGYPQMDFFTLPTIGWPGFRPRLFSFGIKFLQAYLKSRRELNAMDAHAVIGMGGFLCAAPILAARGKRLPTFLHESNAVPGKVTRLLSSKVDKVFLGFAECAEHLPKASTQLTGTPVRTSLTKVTRSKAIKHLKLDPEKKTLVIMGGSQGAVNLNRIVVETLERMSKKSFDWQVIHITGERDYKDNRDRYRGVSFHSIVIPFSDEMEHIYSVADLMIARSGAASLTEIAYYGIPSVLVPFPFAAEDHQTRNAEIFVENEAALLIQESDIKPESMAQQMNALMDDAERMEKMSKAAEGIYQKNATKTIAEEVERALSAKS